MYRSREGDAGGRPLAGTGRILFDRCFISELVYGPLHRGRSRINWKSVLDDLARDAAEKVVQLVPHARRPLAAVKDGEPTASPRRPRMTPSRKSDEAKEERSA
ncbi:hypothetical protein [Streptomyces sp. ISL-100]|uniref:hypothetical protein n=1 Tax=Streptomyces sp. ISL-100 TaxID=2819173 RepID=UPI0020359AA6|nr:hypothetical protein [Streptomyces sp. ISL-100]